jgi:2-oxoglutarate ferredoxin oxidoreductase subunit gamma
MKIMFSGFGGQGILTLGQVVASIAMKKGKHVTWFPSYGAEMRGGTANCTVIISDKIIGSPIVSEEIDILCAMNIPSVMKFLDKVAPGGQVFTNSSIVSKPTERTDIDIMEIDATNIATKIGNPKVANMVMLGAFIRATNVVSEDSIEKVLRDTLGAKKAELLDLNINALKLWKQ